MKDISGLTTPNKASQIRLLRTDRVLSNTRKRAIIKVPMETTTIIKRALIYIRVSTEEQAGDEKQSLKAQKRICQDSIENTGYALADKGIYEDAGKSGTNMKRPGLQDLLIRVQEDKSIGAVFVQDTDRLARNVTDHLAIRAVLRKHEVELVSVSQPGIKDDPEGRMMDVILAGVNQFQSDITRRKTDKSLEEKFLSGGWPTKAPLGYLNAGSPEDPDKRIVIVDKVRAPLVAAMFKEYATGDYSIAEVRDRAYKKGLVTHAGKRVALSKMFSLMRCHFYYGDMHWKGQVKKGNHVPIITKDTFGRCQKIMVFNNKYACRRRKYDFLLRGFTFCATCGQRFTAAHVANKNKSYYYCNRSGDREHCIEKYVAVDDLEKQVQKHFDKIRFSPQLIQRIVSKVQKLYQEQKEVIAAERRRITANKLNLEKKLEVAEEKLIDGVLADRAYRRIKERINEQLSTIEDELYELDRKKNVKMDVIQETLKVVRDIGKAYQDAPPLLKRLYLGLFWEEFRIADKLIVEARKAPILTALEAIGSVCIEKPILSPIQPSKELTTSVQVRTILGG